MPLTKIVKAMAPELRDAGNLDAGVVPEARLTERLREAGKTIPSADYNQALETGFYTGIGAPTGTNAPPELARYGTLIVTRTATAYINQIAGFGSTGVGVNEAQLYYRGSNNNGVSWGGWKKVFHQGSILGTVSHSSGYPTGAIIEAGSNANGAFTKFADGTLFCRHYILLTTTTAKIWGSTTWTFPHAFVSGVHPQATIGSPLSNQLEIAAAYNSTQSTCAVYFNSETALANQGIYVTASGRWF